MFPHHFYNGKELLFAFLEDEAIANGDRQRGPERYGEKCFHRRLCPFGVSPIMHIWPVCKETYVSLHTGQMCVMGDTPVEDKIQ